MSATASGSRPAAFWANSPTGVRTRWFYLAALVLGMVEQAVLYETGRTVKVDGILFGSAPAWQAARADLVPSRPHQADEHVDRALVGDPKIVLFDEHAA